MNYGRDVPRTHDTIETLKKRVIELERSRDAYAKYLRDPVLKDFERRGQYERVLEICGLLYENGPPA